MRNDGIAATAVLGLTGFVVLAVSEYAGELEHFTIADLRDGENLVGKVRLTPVGNFLVELREQLQAKQAADVTGALASTGPR